MKRNGAGPTLLRKEDHLRICLEDRVEFDKSTGFERYEFEHRALPTIDLDEVDASTSLFGKDFKLPFFIGAMTGGTPRAGEINRNLAEAAQRVGIGMGLGSQRAMLEDPGLTATYLVRDVAPGIFLLGNIGAVQVSHYPVDRIREMIERVGADGLAVHLNPVQELVQPEGATDWRNVLPSLERLCRELEFPVVVKEVGCGISREIAMKLESAGVACIDVAGAGGTSFAKVEEHRGSETARIFSEWGIPTAESLRQCAEATRVPLIASGGLRSGLDCAKALAMGASLASFALPLLKAAVDSADAVVRELESFASELRKTMLLVGAATLDQLKKAPIRKVIT